ncbi:hypothetical protein ID866_3570 [Astraeus odoratus]|nr:hypothetical protein ID866_3570 [Astraeus odoratus]
MSHIVEKIEGIMALHALRKFSELASVYHLNLNEKVEQDTESVPVRGSRGIVNWGTLGKQGTQVAVKTISCRLSHNTDVIKV